jgi:hypothetical protein
MWSSLSQCSITSTSVLVGLSLSAGAEHFLEPSKYPQCLEAIIAPLKHMAKFAQLAPSGSRHGMWAVNCSVADEDMVAGAEDVDELVVVCRAGPITCSKLNGL